MATGDGDDGAERLEFWLQHRFEAGTGGGLWSCAHLLARWLFARRELLKSCRIVELACGLGLPSLVAARYAAQVLATDCHPALLSALARSNAASNGEDSDSFAMAMLDFCSSSSVSSVGLACWDIVMFADCIYNAQGGAALPHVLRALLRRGEGAVAIGVMPAEQRPGTDRFWTAVPSAGLLWKECESLPMGMADDDASGYVWARLYAFWLPPAGPPPEDAPCEKEADLAGKALRAAVGEPEDDFDDADVMPLFTDIVTEPSEDSDWEAS